MDEQVVPQQVIFPAADGMMIHGQLFLPKTGGKHPALVFFHGGSRRQMLLGWHYMDAYSYSYGMNQYWASKGYVVLAVNYRSGIGYGLNFREAINYGAGGGSEYNDVLGAGLVYGGPPGCGCEADRRVGRVVWRIIDGHGAGAVERSVRGRRRHDGRARLERSRRQRGDAESRSRQAARSDSAGVRIVAHGER